MHMARKKLKYCLNTSWVFRQWFKGERSKARGLEYIKIQKWKEKGTDRSNGKCVRQEYLSEIAVNVVNDKIV